MYMFSIYSVFIFPKLKEVTETKLTKHDSVEGRVHHTKLDLSDCIMYGPQSCFCFSKHFFFQNIRFGTTRAKYIFSFGWTNPLNLLSHDRDLCAIQFIVVMTWRLNGIWTSMNQNIFIYMIVLYYQSIFMNLLPVYAGVYQRNLFLRGHNPSSETTLSFVQKTEWCLEIFYRSLVWAFFFYMTSTAPSNTIV